MNTIESKHPLQEKDKGAALAGERHVKPNDLESVSLEAVVCAETPSKGTRPNIHAHNLRAAR